jgi:hypothetical protein
VDPVASRRRPPPPRRGDTTLGIFGPFGLIAILLLLSAGAVFCFAGLHWAGSTRLGSPHRADFGNDLYFSASAFVSATNPATPTGGAGKTLQNLRGDGAWLPRHRDRLPAGAVPIQAFSRRESAGEYLLE